MNTFVTEATKSADKKANKTSTTNGMKAFRSTLNANLDFFAKSGNIEYPSLIADFNSAFAEDKELALRNLLHMRDVRGGKGIRDNFRVLMLNLVERSPSVFNDTRLIQAIPKVGRWDDMFVLVTDDNKTLANAVIKLIANELRKDVPDALLCKWLPRSGIVASKLRSYLKWTPKQYRQKRVAHKSVVETPMSANKWTEINYSHVPSRAMMVYRNAYKKQDAERFNAFVESAVKGEVKINSSTLWPHEVINQGNNMSAVQEAQWKQLPNMLEEGVTVLPIVDTSGSMTWVKSVGKYMPDDIATALGIYFADKQKSAFNGLLMTFSTSPNFVNISDCKSLEEKITKVSSMSVAGSTNVEAAFDLILSHAQKHSVPKEDMPSTLLIMSDMQFNQGTSGNPRAYKMAQKKFKAAGYECPRLVFWNLDIAGKNVPVKHNDDGACIVSGFSPNSLAGIMNAEKFDPMNVMLETLNNDRYNIF